MGKVGDPPCPSLYVDIDSTAELTIVGHGLSRIESRLANMAHFGANVARFWANVAHFWANVATFWANVDNLGSFGINVVRPICPH